MLNLKTKRFYRFKPKEIIKKDNFFTKKIKRFINNHLYLKKINARYINKLCLINNLSKRENESKIETFLLITIISSTLLSLASLKIFTMWYIFIILYILSIFLMIYIGTIYISLKLNKIYALFPIAIQLFTDEYVTNNNIKDALNNSYNKMPAKISRVFENLARKFASENDYREVIKDFADGLDFVWGYAFAEIILISYEGAGDISDDLIYLNELSNDEIKSNLETETALAGTKMIFIILNICTVIALVTNVTFLELSKHLYLYTPTGNLGIMVWILSFILGIATLTILKYI